MKRRYNQMETPDEDYQSNHQTKRRRLNGYHIQDNHYKIVELMLNHQKIIEEFKKTIQKLNNKVKESNNKIYELEETVRKQQLAIREYMPPTTFKSPASYYY